MGENGARSALGRLGECVDNLRQGDWRFVQLRDATVSRDSIDGDDIDLLGAPASVEALMEAAFDWVRDDLCHMEIRRTSPFKTALTLFSVDGVHRIDLDLWTEIIQFGNKGVSLAFDGCRSAIEESDESIVRLRPSVEAAIYVHHLVARRKNAGASKHQARLDDYVKRCAAAGSGDLSAVCGRIRERGRVGSADLERASGCLEPEVKLNEVRHNAALRHWWRSRPFSRLLAAPRRAGTIVFMGCDGSGKTSLANRLKETRGDVERVFTGKHLYRKSWFYKLLVIFVRPFLFQTRETFDETFAPVAYIRAAIGLRLKLWRRDRGLMIIDRSNIDFLFVGRKTGRPRFAWCGWLSHVMGCRVPTVHFVLPYERMRERKREVGEEGQRIYDEAMFGHFTGRCPTHYLLFNNGGDLKSAASAINRIVEAIRDER